MLSRVPLTPSYTQAWKRGLPSFPWLWHDAMMGEGGHWHHSVAGKEPSANQSTRQDASPLRHPYIKVKVVFLTQMLLALWKEHLSHKTFLPSSCRHSLFAYTREMRDSGTIPQTLVCSPKQPACIHGLHFHPEERLHINYCVQCTSLRDYWTLSMRL